MHTDSATRFIFLVGRLLVGGVYLGAGAANLIELEGKAGYVASKGLPDPHLWVAVASVLLIIAGLSLAAGFRPRVGVGATALFLVPATIIMHNFWAAEGLARISELHSFMGNVGLLGSALMFLAIPRPWPMSVDTWLRDLRAAGRQPRAA
jgi:uncharacterized membrane protein YphA (DoxX/SURF4 family)